MLIQAAAKRYFSTTPRLLRVIKFDITKEQINEYDAKRDEERQKSRAPTKPKISSSPLLMGKVSSERNNKIIKVGVPKHTLNNFVLMYIRKLDNIYVHDDLNCKPGDWILIRKAEKQIDVDVEHFVERIVYKYGKYIDPITNRRSFGLYYEDDIERLEKIKLEL